MTFDEVLSQVLDLLQREGRLSYRALKRRFSLDDEYLEDLKAEIIDAKRLAADENGTVLVWTGDSSHAATAQGDAASDRFAAAADTPSLTLPHVKEWGREGQSDISNEGERRQLTVMFCDLVGSTALSKQFDPEELRDLIRAYQQACVAVITQFDGRIAKYLGDGLLAYFGYPRAHEDDARRAVRAGLNIVAAMRTSNAERARSNKTAVSLKVRLGIHTGLVVVGEVGGGTRQQQLALGETPNLAARLQGIAAPNTLLISAATLPLLGGFFACQSLGTPRLRGFAQPLEVYQVLYESMARSRLEAVGSTGLTPLVGREQEAGLLLQRWVQVKEGIGQVVLRSGEAGIGKSRLVQVLKEQVAAEPQAWLTMSP